MNWSNWVYLGTGLVLGIGLRGLLMRSKISSSSSSTPLVDQQNLTTLQEKLKQTQLAYYMAREMSQFKAGFLARTTHELRSPLNGLIGLHQLILSNLCENPEEEREFITQAHERALKFLKLIDEILNVARTEHGTNQLNIQPRSLTQLLQEVQNLTCILAANRNFPFRILLPQSEISVLADPYWLKQVLISLIETSISRMEEGSICISVQESLPDHKVHICLDVPTHAVPSSEPIDLMGSDNQSFLGDQSLAILSPGMKFMLNQTLLEMMEGKLEILCSPGTIESVEDLTRLQVTLPIVIPAVEFQQQK